MIEEITTLEQLKRVKRLMQNEMYNLAAQTLEHMIEGREERLEMFEHEYEMDDGA